MGEAEKLSVKGLPPKNRQGVPGIEIEPGRLGPERRPVNAVPKQRVPPVGQVDPDLMRPPRFQVAAHEACLRVGLHHGVMRDGVATGLSDTTAIFSRLWRERARLATIVPVGGCGAPQTKAR